MSPTQTEEKVQFYLNNTKSKLNNTYETLKVYWDATLATFQKFWQFQEFRLCFYLFGLLSAIPVGIFLICVISATCIITVLLSFVWTLAVCTTVTIGLVLLVPVLIAFALVSVLSLVGYSAYTYFVKQTGAKTKTN